MLPELGHFCLILAFCLSLTQALIFAYSFKFNIERYNIMRPLSLGQTFFIFLGFVILAICFVNNDFSVQYVAHNSNSSLPWYYKLTAIWGAHEGSLLLWIFILSIWLLAVVIVSKNWVQSFANNILAVLGLLNLGLIFLLLKTSNPFLRYMADIPLDGADLNPLLQDFGMIIHPPVLYLGYVGSSVAFAFAIAALLANKLDQTWARLVQPWALLAWMFLTLGITLGSWWAYYELGWGGWWFWDPVENASFMPWLTGTALLHCLSLSSKNGQLLRLAMFLAIITFALSILGTFIVRSGVITSVHAFVADPIRGVFILQFLAISVGGSLFLYAWRAPTLQVPSAPRIPMPSIAAAILGNNIILLIAMGTVLLGTLYPLIYDVLFDQRISVGYPYFNAVFVPLMLIMLAILLPTILPRVKILFIVCLVSIIATLLFLNLYFSLVKFNAFIGLSFAVAIIASSIVSIFICRSKTKIAMTVAHLGLAVTIIGISLTPAYEIEQDLRMQLGETHTIGNYKIKFQSLDIVDGPNYIAYQGDFIVSSTNNKIAHLKPEKRLYLAQELPMTETAILPGLLQDIYVALGQQLATNQWSVRIYYKPFVRCIWLGAIIMVFGASCGFYRRHLNGSK